MIPHYYGSKTVGLPEQDGSGPGATPDRKGREEEGKRKGVEALPEVDAELSVGLWSPAVVPSVINFQNARGATA